MYRFWSRSLGIAALLLLTATAAASAKTITVRGTLSRPGYTVVALGYNGKMVISHHRKFKLRIHGRALTLQLLTRSGRYAGPVIVGHRHRFVLEGIRRSVRLGRIRVIKRKGYARVVRHLPARYVDGRRRAFARHGVPIGNGRNFGFVRSHGHAAAGPGLDRDRDGVPDAFDVAVNGRKILTALLPQSNFTPSVRLGLGLNPAVTSPSSTPPPAQFNWMSQIFLSLDQTVNADATGVTSTEINSMLVKQLNLKALDLPKANLVELDCSGLAFCSKGTPAGVVTGTDSNGNLITQPLTNYIDSSGFPVLEGPGAAPLQQGPGGAEFSLLPHVDSSQIQTGDTPILRTTTNGVLTELPEPIQFVFDTVPALAYYSDGAGHSGTITYPASPGQLGTASNPIPVSARSNGDVMVTLHFWRPQRAGIPGAGEPAFMDIGHLDYTVDATSLAQAAANPGTPINASSCSAASLSTSDPSLSLVPAQGGGYLSDSASDQPADPSHLLSFTIDLTKCMTDGGAPGFPVGVQGALGLKANAPNSSDHAVQNIWVKRVS